jgi:hypothetical protein
MARATGARYPYARPVNGYRAPANVYAPRSSNVNVNVNRNVNRQQRECQQREPTEYGEQSHTAADHCDIHTSDSSRAEHRGYATGTACREYLGLRCAWT